MKRSEFRFVERLRVRGAEVDSTQAVFKSHYLTYIDTAMTGYWRALGVPHENALEFLGGEPHLAKVTIEFHAPARFDDALDVGICCGQANDTGVHFKAAVFRHDQTLATAELSCSFVAPNSRQPIPVPQALRDFLKRFESGRPTIVVKLGSWDELNADARIVRTDVFIREQGIPEEMEWDNADPGCIHAVAYNHFGTPLGTGRMIEHVPGIAKIGRMAVNQSVRGSGVGRAVLDALKQSARDRGYREAVLHAQVSAAPFYGRSGFVSRGSVFDDVGIPHIEMVCAL